MADHYGEVPFRRMSAAEQAIAILFVAVVLAFIGAAFLVAGVVLTFPVWLLWLAL